MSVRHGSSLDRTETLRYLADLQSHWSAYHNHKENGAWAGLILYLALLPQVLSAVTRPALLSRLLATALLIALAYLVYEYLRIQLDLRRRAANFVSACMALSARLITGDLAEIDLRLTTGSKEDRRVQASHFVPRSIVEEAAKVDQHGGQTREQLERSAYKILALSTILMIVRIWFAV